MWSSLSSPKLRLSPWTRESCKEGRRVGFMNVRGARAAGGGDKGEAARASAVSPRPLVPSLIPSDGGVSRLLPLAAPLVQTVEPEEPTCRPATCPHLLRPQPTRFLLRLREGKGKGRLSNADRLRPLLLDPCCRRHREIKLATV